MLAAQALFEIPTTFPSIPLCYIALLSLNFSCLVETPKLTTYGNLLIVLGPIYGVMFKCRAWLGFNSPQL